MADTIRCPNCGQTYAMTPEQEAQYAGQTITCTNCNRPFAVGGGGGGGGGGAPTPAYPAGPGGAGGPGGGGYGGPYAPPPGPQKSNGLAIGSLVTGLLGLIVPFLGIVGVILGIFGLRKTRDPSVGGKGLAIAGISIGGASVLLFLCAFSVLLPALSRAREQANRIRCASNLRQIGMAAMMYANENKGQYPPDFQTLLRTQDLTSDVFVCPSTTHTRAQGADAKQQAQNLTAGPHLSYIYAGRDLTARSPLNAIVAYEVGDNHDRGRGPNAGANVLFIDGRVEYVTGIQSVIDELKAGHNPPRPPGQRGQ